MRSLGAFRKEKGFSQEEFGKKLGLSQATYQSYESGRTSIPEEIRAKIKKLGYTGPWPQEEAKVPAADAISREEFAELKGATQAEIRLLRENLERPLRGISACSSRSVDTAPLNYSRTKTESTRAIYQSCLEAKSIPALPIWLE